MLIRCWGARGSIPVSGEQYLKYGGDTTCLEIRTRSGELVIVDAGSGIRALGKEVHKEGVRSLHLIFTHAHLDHVMGFPFFRPIYSKTTRIELYGCPFAQGSVESMLARTMSPPSFPVRFEDVSALLCPHKDCTQRFTVGSMDISPVLLSHPNQGIGYKFAENGRSFVFLTDNELTHAHPGGLKYEDYLAFAEGADLLIHDSEFTAEEYKTTKTWGHSVYTDALRLALEAGVESFGLFHHNQDRSDAALDAMVRDCRRIISERGSKMGCSAVAVGTVFEL
ncbi:MAG: MBL fold metallo-hydrolase [Elusimicrobiota bacterium]